MREQSVSLDRSSSMLLLAGLLSVSFFICFSLGFMVLVHKDFICYLQELCSIHLSEAFQFLKLSLDVCIGLSHKGSINHLLILGCLRVEWGVCLECFTQSVIEIGGSLICFWIIVVILDILVGFLAPTRSPCRRHHGRDPGFLVLLWY